jgi:gluconolactonase
MLECVFDGCTFAEGPAADAEGNVYFSDCPNNRIMLYRTDGSTCCTTTEAAMVATAWYLTSPAIST